ncbi:HK97 gp10 family phage protein [Thermoactinomyces sp. DSM 45892]|uniref:HK97 gp10 family phage protein n=1 Tax=Thermoactinomyces sp. DSM 45892 TaxID=1882753 RepID=UPI00089992C3|nr:HK97 gp10 family phage protein [Thermoactinomyces sp. DSM 45892]SDY71855.1 Bacteriophage HK97-gp10, putative tail-component [Thermoactinomyces sp. DSM 45892]
MPAHIQEDRIREIARKASMAVKQAVEYTALDVWGNIRENSPVSHGRLAGSWQMNRLSSLRYKVQTAVAYARYTNDGTGIYGPRRQPIRPRSGQALVFQSQGRTVFARSVRGMKGRKYIEKSIEQTEHRKAEFVEMALEEVGLI